MTREHVVSKLRRGGTYLHGALDLGEIDLIAQLSIHSTYRIIMATYLSSPTVIDLWVFRRVTDCTEDRRLARVGPADDEDPEATEFLVEVF